MKRIGFLLEQIAEHENLRIGFWKASRMKTGKKEVIDFQNNLEKNLSNLREQLLDLSLDIGDYHYFTIYDPKERIICAASFPERVLHHAIMNICDSYFEKFQIYNSYATRKNKGTFAAVEQAHNFTKRNEFFLKLDVRKYFDSIDHNILMNLLERKFKDTKLLEIFEQIINSYSTSLNKGLPIGNLTSQYFANYYLAFADHFIKENLQVKCFVRYMDDMVLWSTNKAKLKDDFKRVRAFLSEQLSLTLKPQLLNYSSKGLPFLGYLLFPNMIKLNSRSKKRFVKKVKLYDYKLSNEEWSQADYQRHILPLLDFVKKADTYNYRRKIFEKGNNQGLEPCESWR
jgi:retron-type reverse transcriptase